MGSKLNHSFLVLESLSSLSLLPHSSITVPGDICVLFDFPVKAFVERVCVRVHRFVSVSAAYRVQQLRRHKGMFYVPLHNLPAAPLLA